MNSALSNVEATTQSPEMCNEATPERSLPSGRSVVLKVTGEGEELEVRSPSGAVEVRITLSASGSVVHLSGARLELEAVDTVALNCRRLEVNTAESTQLHSAGDLSLTGQEMRVRTTGDIHLNGAVIRLNC
jgi:hypothetical protein